PFIAPLSKSQTKVELLKHLNLPLDTYASMVNETDRVHNRLISEKSYLKENGKRKPPYDWNDFKEQPKDDAVERIARGGDQLTSPFWTLASKQESFPNWIAQWFLYQWFLYHKFRFQ
ncbi:hypothetical protein DL95DRAFT_274702, partial [Leptodontidium sp. 2 PMI_412]